MLAVVAYKFPRALEAKDLYRLGESWTVMFEELGAASVKELDWEGSRSITLRVSHPWMEGAGMAVRCRASGPERIPALVVCLCDGASFGRSLTGLQVR